MAIVIDLVHDAGSSLNIGPVVLSTTVQGASIDAYNLGVDTNMFLAVSCTNSLQVTQLNVQAEESTDGTNNWTLITGMVLTVTSLGNSKAVQVARGLRTQRYLRANAITLSAVTTTGAFPASVVFVANSKYTPSTASGADLYPST